MLTVHGYFPSSEHLKNVIRQEGGVQSMVGIIERFISNEKLLAIVTDCLRMLSMKSPQTKETILHCNGPQLVVGIMQAHRYSVLIRNTSRLLKVTIS